MRIDYFPISFSSSSVGFRVSLTLSGTNTKSCEEIIFRLSHSDDERPVASVFLCPKNLRLLDGNDLTNFMVTLSNLRVQKPCHSRGLKQHLLFGQSYEWNDLVSNS